MDATNVAANKIQKVHVGLLKMSLFLKGPGGVNASLMSFGGTGSHKYVVVRLIEISTRLHIT